MYLATSSKERCRGSQFSCQEPSVMIHATCGHYSSTSTFKVAQEGQPDIPLSTCTWISTSNISVKVLGSHSGTVKDDTRRLVTSFIDSSLCGFDDKLWDTKKKKEMHKDSYAMFQSWAMVLLLLLDCSLLHGSSAKECCLYFRINHRTSDSFHSNTQTTKSSSQEQRFQLHCVPEFRFQWWIERAWPQTIFFSHVQLKYKYTLMDL